MALPAIATAADCANFSKTVTPFLPQLKSLPGLVVDSISDPAALKQLYLDTNPLVSAFAFTLAVFPIFLVLSEINKNYSQVDRAWSILPSIYNVHYAVYAHLLGLETKRLDTLLAASCIWSVRLTYNYWRRGGYQVGSEDYRWEIVRNNVPPTLFFLFNVVFIALAQPVLLSLVTTPTYCILLVSLLASSASGDKIETWTMADLIFSRVLIGCILLAFFGDQQQWQFHLAKHSYQKTAKVPPKSNREDLDRGFLASGLWAWSRHPNYVGEQAFWLTMYQWGCYTTQNTFNWTCVGALSYLILFQASTWLTELITSKKYPEYKEYQARVGKFIPRIGTDAKGGGEWGKVTDETRKAVEDKTGDQNDADAAHARERYNLR